MKSPVNYLTSFLILIAWTLSVNCAAQVQNGLHLDGDQDHIEVNYLGIGGGDPRTIEAWVKADRVSGQYPRIVSWGGYGGINNQGFLLMISPDGVLGVHHGLNYDVLYGSTIVSDSQWHHVAMTFDTTQNPSVRTYVDGQLDSSFNFGYTVNTQLRFNLKIGVGTRPVVSTTTNFYKGGIDEVRVWNYARTQAQLDSFKDAEICPGEAGLVAYYRFNQGVAGDTNSGLNTLMDHSGNDRPGSLMNFTLTGQTSNWVTGAPVNDAPDSDTSFSVTECDIYTTPSGKMAHYSQEILDTIPNSIGCDSVLTIDLTINRSSLTAVYVTGCDSFTSYSGQNTWKESGIYDEVFTNSVGCDSTIRYDLSIDTTSFGSIAASYCELYTAPSGRYTWDRSGIYFDTINSITGCDSILEIDLTIYDASDTTEVSIGSCGSYITSDGRTLRRSGIYYETFPNSYGCDSVVEIDLDILESSFIQLTGLGCDSFVSHSGLNTWHRSGTFFETLTASNGCDSVIQYEVTIHQKDSSSISVSSCGSYTSPSGKEFSSSGFYRDTIASVSGCDSIVKIALNLTVLAAQISEAQGELKALPSGKLYQWLDCADGYKRIGQATNQIFIPSSSGSFAVEVRQNDCADTSDCISFQHAAITDLGYTLLEVYPNPSTGWFQVKTVQLGMLSIRDVNGKLVKSLPIDAPGVALVEIAEPRGIYFLQFDTHDGAIARTMVVKY